MTSMPFVRRSVATATAALLVGVLPLSGCAAPDVDEEADELTLQMGAIPNVSSVGFTYQDLGGWEADEVEYRIDVGPDQDSQVVAEVAAAVYSTVRDDDDVTQAAVSAVLLVNDDELSLRIFESFTPATQVATVVEAVVPELAKGRTSIEVDTSMRGMLDPVDLSVHQEVGRPLDQAQTQQAEAEWQQVIDRVGRGGAHVGW